MVAGFGDALLRAWNALRQTASASEDKLAAQAVAVAAAMANLGTDEEEVADLCERLDAALKSREAAWFLTLAHGLRYQIKATNSSIHVYLKAVIYPIVACENAEDPIKLPLQPYAQHLESICSECQTQEIEAALEAFCSTFPERGVRASTFLPALLRGAPSASVARNALSHECLRALGAGFEMLAVPLRQAIASNVLPALLRIGALSPHEVWNELKEKRSLARSSESLTRTRAYGNCVYVRSAR